MKIIGFYPLRGGSVSIPLKNIKPLNGRPLAYYGLDAFTQCPLIDHVVVATDYEEIASVIRDYPAKNISVVGRSPEVSSNTSPTIDVMLEVLEEYDFDIVVLAQATSPLLQSEDITRGVKLMLDYDSVLSVVRQHRFVWDEDTHKPNYPMPNKPRRQDWRGILVENGAFYITTKEQLFRDKFYLSGNVGLCEMPAESFVELDEEYDWITIEQILKHRKNISK